MPRRPEIADAIIASIKANRYRTGKQLETELPFRHSHIYRELKGMLADGKLVMNGPCYYLRADEYAQADAHIPEAPATERELPSEDVDLSDLDPEDQSFDTGDALKAHRLRQKVAELEIAKKKLLKELHDRDQQIDVLSALRAVPRQPIVARAGRGEGMRRVGTPVALFSDWHVEEPVAPESVGGLNVYNLDIADKCISECADAFEWLGRDPRFDCREAVIWLGGDHFSGYIHDELEENNFLSPVQAV